METDRNPKAIAFILSTRYSVVFSSFVMLHAAWWLADE
jgi:hypothetical protein